MGDLISRSKLIEIIDKEYPNINRMDIKSIVNNAPTAYNVDEVVERVRQKELCPKCVNNINSVQYCSEFCDIGRKLMIVKGGGANE